MGKPEHRGAVRLVPGITVLLSKTFSLQWRFLEIVPKGGAFEGKMKRNYKSLAEHLLRETKARKQCIACQV